MLNIWLLEKKNAASPVVIHICFGTSSPVVPKLAPIELYISKSLAPFKFGTVGMEEEKFPKESA